MIGVLGLGFGLLCPPAGIIIGAFAIGYDWIADEALEQINDNINTVEEAINTLDNTGYIRAQLSCKTRGFYYEGEYYECPWDVSIIGYY